VVADRTQGKPKPIGEAEKMPGTGEVTRDFFIIQEVNGEGKVILREQSGRRILPVHKADFPEIYGDSSLRSE
jgi:hypothetical protein